MEDNKNIIAPEETSAAPEAVEEESLADRVRIISPGRLVAKRFFRSRLSVVGLVALIVLFAFSFIGPLFVRIYAANNWEGFNSTSDLEIFTDMTVPSERREQYNTGVYYQTVDKVTAENRSVFVPYVDKDGKVVKNFYYSDVYSTGEKTYILYDVANDQYRVCYDQNAKPIIYTYTEYSWDRKTFNQLGKMDGNHWFGTDEQGMDVFVRLMYGGRVSLTLGFLVVILQTIFGIILGGLAGYFGKWVDTLIMRIVDIFNCLPSMPILLIISAVLDGMELDQKFRIYYLLGIMTLLGWAGIARMVRGQILYLREQEFMVAAEALGLSVPRKIIRHLIPNIMPQLIVQMTLGLGGIILTESTLSYLGIGIPIPYAAWGTMISAAQKPEILKYYPNLWIPAGCLIVIAVLAFNFVGDGLRDAFDPKASR